MVSAHPNRSIHQLSLLSSESSAGVHSQKLERKGNVTPIGNDEAQAFWLNQSRCIDWIKQPTIAYGLVDGDKVSSRPDAPTRLVDFTRSNLLIRVSMEPALCT